MDSAAGLAAQMQRNLSHSSLHNSSELSLPPGEQSKLPTDKNRCHSSSDTDSSPCCTAEGTGNGLSGSQQMLGSQSSLQGLDPTHDL